MGIRSNTKATRRPGAILLLFMAMMMAAGFALSGCEQQIPGTGSESGTVSDTAFMLDTNIRITLYGDYDPKLIKEAFDEIARLQSILDVNTEGSDPYKLWQNAGKEWTAVQPETREVIDTAIQYSVLSGGYFDITIGPLVKLWNIKDGKGHVPTDQEREAAMKLVDYGDIVFDGNNIMLRKEGMRIDLGAIAKGYIADKVKEFLMAKGVTSGIIDLGGNILLIGSKPNGEDFRVGIQDPFGETGDIIGSIAISDKSLVSSGDYERYFEVDGKRYHHIVDPFTGYPGARGLSGVTIISDKSVDGDALSTTVFLMGPEDGLKLIESLDNVEAVLITTDGKVITSKGLTGKIDFTDK